MKVILVVDGSSYSDIATRLLEALCLAPQTKVTVMTVVPENTFLGGITLGKLGVGSVKKEAQKQKVLESLKRPAQTLGAHKLNVDSQPAISKRSLTYY